MYGDCVETNGGAKTDGTKLVDYPLTMERERIRDDM